MAISPVGSVYFKDYSISFNGKKNENKGRNCSNPIHHKLAIPAAALILSMYPSNNIYAQDNFNTNEITQLYKKTDKFEILHSRVLSNWYNFAGEIVAPHTTVHFISNDGNEDNIESVILEYRTSKDDPKRKIIVELKQLKEIQYTDSKGNNKRTEYVALGDAVIINHDNVRKAKYYPVDIDKDSFNYLTQFMNGDVNNKAFNSFIITEIQDY